MQSESQGIDIEYLRQVIERKILRDKLSSKTIEAVYLRRLIKVMDKKGKQYIYWIFHGHGRDYVIIPRILCTCRDFLIHVVAQHSRKTCYHLEAQALAEKTGKYNTINIDDQEADTILLEILRYEYSPTLRRILISRIRGQGN